MIIMALAGIIIYAFFNIKYLIWNLIRFRGWKQTEDYEKLRSSNAETKLLAIPLWLNRGLVDAGLVVKFSPSYWVIATLALVIHFATIWLVFILNRKHFGSGCHQNKALYEYRSTPMLSCCKELKR